MVHTSFGFPFSSSSSPVCCGASRFGSYHDHDHDHDSPSHQQVCLGDQSPSSFFTVEKKRDSGAFRDGHNARKCRRLRHGSTKLWRNQQQPLRGWQRSGCHQATDQQDRRLSRFCCRASEAVRQPHLAPTNASAGRCMSASCEALNRLLTGYHRYMPAIGRFLIVVTFLEDALRIITQWSDQILYLHDYRHSTHAQSSKTGSFYNWQQFTDFVCDSSQRTYPSVPHRQCSRNGRLLRPRHRPPSLRICRRWSHRCCRYPGARLRSDLRPELLPAQPVCHGRSPDGPVRLVGPEDQGIRRPAPDRGEGPQDVLPVRWSCASHLPLCRLRVQWTVVHLEGTRLRHRSCRLRHGCSGIQGEVERHAAGVHPECLQRLGEQLLDCKLLQSQHSFFLGLQKTTAY